MLKIQLFQVDIVFSTVRGNFFELFKEVVVKGETMVCEDRPVLWVPQVWWTLRAFLPSKILTHWNMLYLLVSLSRLFFFPSSFQYIVLSYRFRMFSSLSCTLTWILNYFIRKHFCPSSFWSSTSTSSSTTSPSEHCDRWDCITIAVVYLTLPNS